MCLHAGRATLDTAAALGVFIKNCGVESVGFT
jgi:hypothetical protein